MSRKKVNVAQVQSIGFDAAMLEAERIQSGHIGHLAWLDQRCTKLGMHALSPWWGLTFSEFYASGKADLAGCVGLRGGKSDSVIRALVADALFIQRTLDPGTVGVVPIMSARKDDANDRLKALKLVLSASGMSPENEGDGVPALPNGVGGLYSVATNGTAGGGIVSTVDSQGHALEFRVLPAKKNAAIGYTALGGFCDELDQWSDNIEHANPADSIIDLLRTRTTTQPDAHLYFFSTSYNRASAHSRMIAAGDTAIQHVVKLGKRGAEIDTESRRRLAKQIKSTDPRLLRESLPTSPFCPTWVAYPAMTIEQCFARSKEDLNILLAWYGGRAEEAPGTRTPTIDGLVEMNERLNSNAARRAPTLDGYESHERIYGLQTFPDLPPSDPRSACYRSEKTTL